MNKINFNILKKEMEDFDLVSFKKSLKLNHLKLKNSEVKEFANFLKTKKEIEENCLKDKNYCKNNNILFHVDFARDENKKLFMYAKWCPRQINNNFLYNSFKDSEISQVKWEKTYFKDKNESLLNIFNEFKNTNFENLEKSKGFYIYGNFGVGKTHLCFAIANWFLKKNFLVSFINLSDLLAKMKSGFSNENKKYEAEKIIQGMFDANILFIDDIGSENSAEWFFNEIFMNILNERMIKNKKTFFNSNYNIKSLEKNFVSKYKNGDLIAVKRIMDRIKALTNNKEFELKGKNRRY